MRDSPLYNFPAELREKERWILWRYEEREGRQTKIPYSAHTGYPCDVSKPESWASFETVFGLFQAASVPATGGASISGIGYCLHQDDGYSCIDLDAVKPGSDAEYVAKTAQLQQRIFETMGSYSEISPSGHGLHIWVRGTVQAGIKAHSCEVYSHDRYMTVTGQVYHNVPIASRQEVLIELEQKLSDNRRTINVEFRSNVQTRPDEEIISSCYRAANSEVFALLHEGRWHERYNNDQSRADQAYMDFLVFHSRNFDQCRRIFLSSVLGSNITRKAKPEYYINLTYRKAWDNIPPAWTDEDQEKVNRTVAIMQAEKERAEVPTEVAAASVAVPAHKGEVVAGPPVAAEGFLRDDPMFPRGLVGDIARYVYQASPRQVPELALAAALGFMGGICGRAYNVNGLGCNLYIVAVAKTGFGKQTIPDNMNVLMRAVRGIAPQSLNFIGPDKISSAPALMKHFSSGQKSFVSVIDEYGIKLKAMNNPKAPPAVLEMKAAILEIYSKSGDKGFSGEIIYSDRDKKVEGVKSPAFTIIGQTTPEELYSGLDASAVTSGFLPRFLVLEDQYGKQRHTNYAAKNMKPDVELIQAMIDICNQSKQLNSNDKVLNVRFTDDAHKMVRDFDSYCTDLVNRNIDNQITCGIWTRIAAKAVKIAALVAIGINYFDPVIDAYCFEYAVRLCEADANNINSKFERGEIGIETNLTAKDRAVKQIVNEFITNKKLDAYGGYGVNSKMKEDNIISRDFLKKRMAMRSVVFGDVDKFFDSFVDTTIKSLIAAGAFEELMPNEKAAYNLRSAKVYRIVDPGYFA